MDLTYERFKQIKEHYERLAPVFPEGFGYLSGHNGWYVRDENGNPGLSQYKDFLSRLNMSNRESLVLFSTFNRYNLLSKIWTEIPLRPSDRPDKPDEPYITAIADEESIGYQVTIDIDMKKKGAKINDYLPEAHNIIKGLKEFFKDTNCLLCFSGNGLYVKFPTSSFSLVDMDTQQKDTYRTAWGIVNEKLDEYLKTNYPDEMEHFKIDNIINSNRQIKAIGAIHKKNGYVVLPIKSDGKIRMKYVWELTEDDYKDLEAIIPIIYDNPYNSEPNGCGCFDLIDKYDTWDRANDIVASKNQHYNGGRTFSRRDDKIPLSYLHRDPLLKRLFDPKFQATKPNHRCITMVYYLTNMGYDTDEIIKILEEPAYDFSEQMIDDAIRLGIKSFAPNYKTVMRLDAAYPAAGNKSDFGDIKLEPVHWNARNPVEFISSLYEDERKLINAVENIEDIDLTEYARGKAQEISEKMIEDGCGINIIPPRCGKTHSIIATLIEQDKPSLIFGENHEQIMDMTSKFPELYHWKGKQLLCNLLQQDEPDPDIQKCVEMGVDPCGYCKLDYNTRHTCEWKKQLVEAPKQKHIMINKANIPNHTMNTVKKYDDKPRQIVFDENLHEVSSIDYKDLNYEFVGIFNQFLNFNSTEQTNNIEEDTQTTIFQGLDTQELPIQYIPNYDDEYYNKLVPTYRMQYNIEIQEMEKIPLEPEEIENKQRYYESIRVPDNVIRLIRQTLDNNPDHITINIINQIQEQFGSNQKRLFRRWLQLNHTPTNKAIFYESQINQYLTNLEIIRWNKKNGRIEFGEKLQKHYSYLDTLHDAQYLLDATPSPRILENNNKPEYDIHLPKTGSLIIRPVYRGLTLTFSKETSKNISNDTYIKWIKNQINIIKNVGLSVGLITYKNVDGRNWIEQFYDTIPPEDTLYYGNVRGRNNLDDKDVLILLGTPKPHMNRIYPEYKYIQGQLNRYQIQGEYSKGQIQMNLDGTRQRITEDPRYDQIQQHETEAEIYQSILRNRAHIKTRLIISISTTPKQLTLPEAKFNWENRDRIHWEEIYKKYYHLLVTGEPLPTKHIHQILTTPKLTQKEQILKQAKDSNKRRGDLKKFWNTNEEVQSHWKSYKGFQKALSRFKEP